MTSHTHFRWLFGALFLSLFTIGCAQTQKPKVEEIKVATPDPKAAQKNDNGNLEFACLVGKDVRLVEVEESKNRCEVHYTKFGEKTQVAWAEATPSICSKVTDQIRTNIESSGFKCDKNIAGLQVERKSAALE